MRGGHGTLRNQRQRYLGGLVLGTQLRKEGFIRAMPHYQTTLIDVVLSDGNAEMTVFEYSM